MLFLRYCKSPSVEGSPTLLLWQLNKSVRFVALHSLHLHARLMLSRNRDLFMGNKCSYITPICIYLPFVLLTVLYCTHMPNWQIRNMLSIKVYIVHCLPGLVCACLNDRLYMSIGLCEKWELPELGNCCVQWIAKIESDRGAIHTLGWKKKKSKMFC